MKVSQHVKKTCSVIATLAVSAALAVSLSACSANKTEEATQTQTPTKVVDVYGRAVTLPEQIDTCATVGSAARFVVYAGAQDKLIAVTEKENPGSPARPYTIAHNDLFVNLPTTSNGNHLMETSVDTEQLLSLAPDVIISSRSAEECDALQQQLGIPVVGISYQDQMFADDVYNSIMLVGTVLGTEEHAASVVAAMQAWKKDLTDRTAGIPEEERALCYAGAVNYKGAKSFGGTYASYAPFEAAGVINVADASGQKGSMEIDLEQLGVWNPEYMFLNPANMDLMTQDYQNNTAFFQSMTAFQNGNVYTQPSYNMNGTNIELAICDAYFVAATVYPERFADINLAEKYDEIFETMLGVPYYETMKSKGMDFTTITF